jgi:hypothetical protein
MAGSNWQSFGAKGNRVGEFGVISDLALDSRDRIYIADSANRRLVRIDDMSGAGWLEYPTAK